MVTGVRYKDFVAGCVLVALLGNGDRLLYWGGMAVLTAATLLLISWLAGWLR